MNPASEHEGLSLPGYTLSTRLGAGGYGEVWLAHAPGGLTKAVKFIYGSFHEKRAEHELKALQRMKDLRHPFLLSLERIEVVDGRLVIVTELAESSLKDRFDQCRSEGLRGIPRQELLDCLHDAADALDFLTAKHSLQHLDIKPENLLLVAGHVKVADFGLVKDVGNSQASLVGGLTPLYSAPEVFQGNPSARSDQYSLAVLYQEMLTGELPFPGVNAAELTLQHMHEEPDLSPLPPADRYVVSRALAKDSSQRFESCSELVEALLKAESCDGAGWSDPGEGAAGTARSFESVLPERRAAPRPGPITEFFDEQIAAPRKELSKSMLLDWEPPASTPPRCLPAIQLSTENFAAQPTLVIGIGGIAGSVLKQLRAKLAKQFGDERLPAVQMLLLDSDPKALAAALKGEGHTALKPEETLALPLRRPQDYREQSGKLMRWLSRRWLYNIPKSLRTEGLRPLGRLALADHARQAVQRIRMALAQATDPQATRQSCELSHIPFRSGAARVYLVASISGGAGGGMSLDIGAAVRTVLDKAGVADSPIIGIFLHSAGHDPRHCDLSRVNTYAWLTEYNHFHGPGGSFPGDESCGLPALAAGKKAFDSAYLVDLGAELDDSQLQSAAQSVAEYVYLDALTPAQVFFNECRRRPEPTATPFAPLRTFTLEKIAAVADDAVERAAATLSRAVTLRWAGDSTSPAKSAVDPKGSDTNQIVHGAATLVSQLQLQLEGLASNARGLIEGQFGGDQQAFIDNLMTVSREDGQAAGPAEMVRIVECLFAPPPDHQEGAFVLQRPLEAILSPLTMKLAGDLARWVLRKLDDRQERLKGAQRAAQWLVDHLTRLEGDAARLAAGLSRQLAASAEELRGAGSSANAPNQEAWNRAVGYFRMRVDLQAVVASSLIARRLLSELKSVGDTIAEFGRHLKHLAASMPGVQDDARHADPLAAAMMQNLTALADVVDQRLQDEFITPGGGLFQTIMGNARVRGQMLAALGQGARQAVEQFAARPELLQSTFASAGGASQPIQDAASKAAPPKLLAHGGLYRGLAIVPQQASSEAAKLIANRLGAEPSVLTGVGPNIILCHEGWDLPLPAVAVDLIQRRRDYADFAARVATRNDICWTPLAAPTANSAVACENAFADAMPAMTHVL